MPAATFAALRVPTFRIYLAGHAVASLGTWIRGIAQDWLVLELTGSPAAVGVTMACQFLPVLALGLHGGLVADRFPRRTLLFATQGAGAVLAATLAALTLSGRCLPVYVDLIALAGGLVLVVDNPTRQAFANETVPARHLPNAVALVAAVFQTTRLLGPAVASVLIGTLGIGWAFVAEALCCLGPMSALALLRPVALVPRPVTPRAPGQAREVLRVVAARPRVAVTVVLVGVVGTFGLNFPVVLTGMADRVFHGGVGLYGLFNVALAVGSVFGALLAGGRARTRLRTIVAAAAAFGFLQVAASQVAASGIFLVVIAAMGAANLAFQAMANAAVQTGVEPAVRGRVMGLYMLAFTGGTPLGAPLIGWITDTAGPRMGMAVCGAVPLLAAATIAAVLAPAHGSWRRRSRSATVRPRLLRSPRLPARQRTRVRAPVRPDSRRRVPGRAAPPVRAVDDRGAGPIATRSGPRTASGCAIRTSPGGRADCRADVPRRDGVNIV